MDSHAAEDATEPPTKRPRLTEEATNVSSPDDEQVQKETACGITAFVNPQTATFSGVLKQRYTDFLVNEILIDGSVLHLRSLQAPKRRQAAANDSLQKPPKKPEQAAPEADPKPPPADAEVSAADREALQALFGSEFVDAIVKLDKLILQNPQRHPRNFDAVSSPPIESRPARTEAHQTVRRVFHSRLETQTQEDNTIRFVAAPRRQQHSTSRSQNPNQPAGKLGWDELGGEFVHFTLYKENKDTMECISFLATQAKMNNKRFQFGGTKDRRAVTVQRASVFRVHADELERFGKRLRHAELGDFVHQRHGLQLGQLGGNEFVISLRDCHFPGEAGLSASARLRLANQTLASCVPAFQRDGFINYYGLQRFGTFRSSTDAIGVKMLQGDLEGAVNDILHYSPDALAAAQNDDAGTLVSSDDKYRAAGLHLWQTTKDASKALERIPKKFSAECSIVRALGAKNKSHQTNFQGALMAIPRTLRLMYVHAYQSLVWNVVAGERWRVYGQQVVEGDLVVIDPSALRDADADEEVDEAGEPIVQPAADDTAAKAEDRFTRARPLSKDEAASGQYTVFDIVLPLPGYDVEYPSNAIGKVYETFMASERGGGLDPHNMRRSWKDASLSGGYRSFLARPLSPMSYEVKTYTHDDEQLAETDWDRLGKEEKPADGGESATAAAENGQAQVQRQSSEDADTAKIAVVLKLQLGPSQYATMALRELMGAGGVKTYKSDYGAGRS